MACTVTTGYTEWSFIPYPSLKSWERQAYKDRRKRRKEADINSASFISYFLLFATFTALAILSPIPPQITIIPIIIMTTALVLMIYSTPV